MGIHSTGASIWNLESSFARPILAAIIFGTPSHSFLVVVELMFPGSAGVFASNIAIALWTIWRLGRLIRESHRRRG